MEYQKTTSFKKFTKNNSEPVANKNDKEIPKVSYISPEERKKVIDNLIFNVIV